MVTKENYIAETAVVLMETLRKLECRFAIATFGNRQGQRVIKKFDDRFKRSVGQKVLESFTFCEGSYPATGLEAVTNAVWRTEVAPSKNTHRIVLMITDGISEEMQAENFKEVIKNHKFTFCVINARDDPPPGNAAMPKDIYHTNIDNLLREVTSKSTRGSLYQILSSREHDAIPIAMSTVISNCFASIIDSIPADEKNHAFSIVLDSPLQKKPEAKQEADKPIFFYQIDRVVGNLDYKACVDEGGGKAVGSMFSVSRSDNELRRSAGELHDHSQDIAAVITEAQDGLTNFLAWVARSPVLSQRAIEADKSWATATQKLAFQIHELASALEDTMFSFNRFTRRRADLKGSQLYLPGLIKAVVTDYSYKKFFCNKSAGGKREYSVWIVVDVSLSMSGHLADCAMETLVMLVGALLEVGIESFGILLFGERVWLCKTEQQDWNASTILGILSCIRFDMLLGSVDADAIECALALAGEGSPRRPRKIFVVSDGYSTCGMRLNDALIRAESKNVDVIGLAVGMDKTFVDSCYKAWIKAALPLALPDAFRAFQKDEESSEPMTDNVWSKYSMELKPGADIDEILAQRSTFFKGLTEELNSNRSATLVSGSGGNSLSVDLCFVIDCTGSMKPYMAKTKQQLKAIIDGLLPKIKVKFPHLGVTFRFGLLGFRDFLDNPKFVTLSPTDKFVADSAAFVSQMNALEAKGGGDIPEDVLGALDHVADWGDAQWKSRARFAILVTDAPGHGVELNDLGAGDSYPNGQPGVTAQSVMKKLKQMRIELALCHIDKPQTQKMETAFRRHYAMILNEKNEIDATQKDTRVMLCTELFQVEQKQSSGFHLYFVLDESGSMCGSWASLVTAYQTFLSTRNGDQGFGDRVTVIQFDSNARLVFSNQDSKTCPTHLSIRGGGTNFEDAFRMLASSMIDDGLIPMVLFMSDGCGDGNWLPFATAIKSKYEQKGLLFRSVAFGSADLNALQTMARTFANGQCLQALNATALTQTFGEIASSLGATEGLVTMLGAVVAEAVCNKLVLDFL